MPKSKEPETYYVCILHCHGNEYSSTVGSIEIGPTKSAERTANRHIEFWLGQQERKHNCKRQGNNCSVDIRLATGLKGVALMSMAKPILPQEAAPTR